MNNASFFFIADHRVETRSQRCPDGRIIVSLARANGWDQPVSARGAHGPKTPATGEQVCRVAAAGQRCPPPSPLAGVNSACPTPAGTREAIV